MTDLKPGDKLRPGEALDWIVAEGNREFRDELGRVWNSGQKGPYSGWVELYIRGVSARGIDYWLLLHTKEVEVL